jgi:hypothetical protein
VFRNGCPYSYQALGTLWVHWDCESDTEFGNDAITRAESRSAALWERHMGKRRRRLTLPKQRRVGVAHQPMKVPRCAEKKFLIGHACLTWLPDSPSFTEASLVTGESRSHQFQPAGPCKFPRMPLHGTLRHADGLGICRLIGGRSEVIGARLERRD